MRPSSGACLSILLPYRASCARFTIESLAAVDGLPVEAGGVPSVRLPLAPNGNLSVPGDTAAAAATWTDTSTRAFLAASDGVSGFGKAALAGATTSFAATPTAVSAAVSYISAFPEFIFIRITGRIYFIIK